ncbi:MAG: hypothetical protein NVS1B5_16640 [Gemmatimonadaceae bacterium]
MKMPFVRIGPICFVLAVTGCGSDSTAPSAFAGSYTAVQFVTTGSAGQTNQVIAGITLRIS